MVGAANSLSNWSTTQYVVDQSAAFGSYTTIAAANAAATAAGGGQIFIRPSLSPYTESLTLGAGVGLVSDTSTPPVFGAPLGAVIDGTITITNAGQNALTGVSFTNSSGGPCFTTTGSNQPLVFVQNCIFVGGAGAILQGTNGNANVLFNQCKFVATSGDFVSLTGAQYQFANCAFLNAGGTGNLTFVGGGGEFNWSDVGSAISVSSGANVSASYSSIQSVTTADTAGFDANWCDFNNTGTIISMAGSGGCKLYQCVLQANGAAAIDIGAANFVQIDQAQINSSGGTYAITGTGTLNYGLLELPGAVQTLDPGLNISVMDVLPYASTSIRGLAYFNSGQFTVASDGEVSLSGGLSSWIDETSTFSAQIGGSYYIIGSGMPTCELPPNLSFPASPVQGSQVSIIVRGVGATVVLQAETGQKIAIANAISSSGGTMTSSLRGDAVTLIYSAADSQWNAQNFIGTWTPS